MNGVKCGSREWKTTPSQGQVYNCHPTKWFRLCGKRVRPIAAEQHELGWDGRGVESLGGNDLLMTSGHRTESFLGRGLKVRQPIHWPCDLFPGPPSIYKHNESYVYAGNAWVCLRWALHRDSKYILLVSAALFRPYFITVCHRRHLLQISPTTGCAHLWTVQ